MDELLRYFLDRLGEPAPCELCRTMTAKSELREVFVPGAVVESRDLGLDFVVDRLVFVCPACPG